MIKFREYIMVDNIEDLKSEEIIWEEYYAIRIDGYGIFHNIDEVSFPCCFKCLEYGNAGHCAEWFPCDKEKMIQRIEKDIEEDKKILEKIKNGG